MKIVVTGGAGFIGSHVVDYLVGKNHEVVIVDNLSKGKDHWIGKALRPKIHQVDVCDLQGLRAVFESERPEAVFHLAAHHYIPFCEENVFEAYNLNVVGTLNVLESAQSTGCRRFFFASTGDVYPPAYVPHREVDLISPIYVYGHTKMLGEQLVTRYFESKFSDGAVIIGRLFNAVGKRETNPHFIPEMIKQVKTGKALIEVGNTWPKRDFVDVNSMARVISELTLQAKGIDVVNIGSGVVQEIGAILDMVSKARSGQIEFRSVAARQRPNDRPFLCPDVSKVTRLLGFAASPVGPNEIQAILSE